jgi:hypothetical protein
MGRISSSNVLATLQNFRAYALHANNEESETVTSHRRLMRVALLYVRLVLALFGNLNTAACHDNGNDGLLFEKTNFRRWRVFAKYVFAGDFRDVTGKKYNLEEVLKLTKRICDLPDHEHDTEATLRLLRLLMAWTSDMRNAQERYKIYWRPFTLHEIRPRFQLCISNFIAFVFDGMRLLYGAVAEEEARCGLLDGENYLVRHKWETVVFADMPASLEEAILAAFGEEKMGILSKYMALVSSMGSRAGCWFSMSKLSRGRGVEASLCEMELYAV